MLRQSIRLLECRAVTPYNGLSAAHPGCVSRMTCLEPIFISGQLGSNRFGVGERHSSSSSSGKGSGKGSFVIKALAGGAVIGTAYALAKHFLFSQEAKGQGQIGNMQQGPEDFLLKETVPDLKVSRSIVNPADNTGIKFTLFQYQPCPFCCKARAVLDYYGLNYDVIEVNSITRTQVKWSSYKKVPMLIAKTPDGKVMKLTDSSMIITAISSFLMDKSQSLLQVVSCFPRIEFVDDAGKKKEDIMNKYFLMFKEAPANRSKEDIVNERKWRRWVDDELVHKLSPNVYRTPTESLQAFNWFDEMGDWPVHFAAWERALVIYLGAAVMWVVGKRLKKRHKLKEDVRQSLYDDVNHWVRSIRKRNAGPFMGGERPNLADLAVFGVLGAIEGCDAFEDVLANTQIRPWFEAMKKSVSSHEGQFLLQGR